MSIYILKLVKIIFVPVFDIISIYCIIWVQKYYNIFCVVRHFYVRKQKGQAVQTCPFVKEGGFIENESNINNLHLFQIPLDCINPSIPYFVLWFYLYHKVRNRTVYYHSLRNRTFYCPLQTL